MRKTQYRLHPRQMRLPTLSCVKGCVVHAPWPDGLVRHVRVLINPANDSLTGPQRPVFPRGGPVPLPTSDVIKEAGDSSEFLYPAQAVDGLVHLQGGAAMRAALFAAAPILETREGGDHLRCRPGEAVLTTGEDGTASDGHSGLPFDAIVHTVPPFWPRDPSARDEWASTLFSCYTASFQAAKEFASQMDPDMEMPLAIACPVLGTGARGAPFAPATSVLARAAAQHLQGTSHETSLRVVVNSASRLSEIHAVQRALDAEVGEKGACAST